MTNHLSDAEGMLEVMEGHLVIVQVHYREEVPEHFYFQRQGIQQA